VTGTKEPIYDARPLVQASGGNVIFVVGNYRLSALGFLGGSRFISEGGVPNAGFWDQRAVQEWIQENIHLVNGDASQVSLWGESAGAGSVMHHLTAGGGKLKALFKRAFVQSPWNVPKYDPAGKVDQQYHELGKQLKCTTGSILTCLRKVPADTLRIAVDRLVANVPFGQFGFGYGVLAGRTYCID
jgi:carboxylesterase type B